VTFSSLTFLIFFAVVFQPFIGDWPAAAAERAAADRQLCVLRLVGLAVSPG